MWSKLVCYAVPIGALLFLAGCGQKSADETKVAVTQAPQPPAVTTPPAVPTNGGTGETPQSGDEHGHKAGQHGGLIVEIGRDNYHAEAVLEREGVLRIHTLGQDEGRIQEVELQALTAYARPAEGGEAVPFALEAEPQPGDAPDKTSVFLGTLPEELRGANVEITVPSIRINGERFRFSVSLTVVRHDEGMPVKVNDAEEEALYLTPGGLYSEADIRANNKLTASKKFKGLMSSHDMKPKSGDRICPVTMTKASPKFTWIVGGRAYEFCCPPCVDEFVRTAKERPDEIKAPEEYVQQ